MFAHTQGHINRDMFIYLVLLVPQTLSLGALSFSLCWHGVNIWTSYGDGGKKVVKSMAFQSPFVDTAGRRDLFDSVPVKFII